MAEKARRVTLQPGDVVLSAEQVDQIRRQLALAEDADRRMQAAFDAAAAAVEDEQWDASAAHHAEWEKARADRAGARLRLSLIIEASLGCDDEAGDR